MIGGLLFIICSFRNRITNRGDASVQFECATISLLILLYSPITWKQHCVGVIPALYLICRMRFVGYRLPHWIFAALTVYALFALVLSRELIGQGAVKLLDSYRVKTAAIRVLTGIVLSCHHLITTPYASGAETGAT